jgi:subtilisin family serine protease
LNHKLDLHLHKRIVAHNKAVAETRPSEPLVKAERVRVILECQGPVSDLTAVGFETISVIEHPKEHYKIVTGSIPVDRLEDLAAIDHVVTVEGSRPIRPALNYSVPEIHADALRNGTPSRTGKGVVIGIIDSGIDWRHGAFIDPTTGHSRILAIWDQMGTPGDGKQTPANPFNYGVEYQQNDINNALSGNGKDPALDSDKKDGHGTHVAGIAAGNGVPATCCHGGSTYIGVAPGASLIAVHCETNTGLGDAMNYIVGHPLALGKPVVMNISLGTNLGAHDGTDMMERAINALIATGPRRAVVVAAGNSALLTSADYITLCHVKAAVPNTTVEIPFTIRDGCESDAALDLWYDRAGTLNLEVIADGGATSGVVNHGTTPPPFPANPGASADYQVTVTIRAAINGQFGRDNNFGILIGKPKQGNIPKGEWKLKLTNPNATAVNFHCWIESQGMQPVFQAPVNPPDGKIRASNDSTLTVPATATGAISVANHQFKTSWCDICPSQDIAPSSGRGPVARNASTNPKPDIAAPGINIASVNADAANLKGNCCACCPDACCCLYHELQGTSMSAPHVTGTIALMLEAKPNLAKADILTLFQQSADPPPPGGTPDTWGVGKLNALTAVNKALAFGGGGGGGGGGHIVHESPDMDRGFSRQGRRGSWQPGGNHAMNEAAPPRGEIWFQRIRSRLETLPEGVSLAASISRHFSEVRRLINHNRKVAAMWHRTSGPRMLRRLLQCGCEDRAPAFIAAEIHQVYFDRWWDLLMKYGSQQLQECLARHRSTILSLVGLQTDSPRAEVEAVPR